MSKRKSMEVDQYAKVAASTAIYPIIKAGIPVYPALKISGEAGEFEEAMDRLDVKQVLAEAGDITWYLAMIARDIGFDASVVLSQMELPPRTHQRGDVLIHAARISEAVGKWIRDESITKKEEAQVKIARLCRELAWALTAAIRVHGLTLGEAMAANAKKLADRKARDVIQGSGDER